VLLGVILLRHGAAGSSRGIAAGPHSHPGLARLLQEADQVGRADQRERPASDSGQIRSFRTQYIERQDIPLQPPDLRNSQLGRNTEMVQRAVSDIHLDRKVRRRIGAQFESVAACHPVRVGDPEGFIRFNAAAPTSGGTCLTRR